MIERIKKITKKLFATPHLHRIDSSSCSFNSSHIIINNNNNEKDGTNSILIMINNNYYNYNKSQSITSFFFFGNWIKAGRNAVLARIVSFSLTADPREVRARAFLFEPTCTSVNVAKDEQQSPPSCWPSF